MYRNGVRCDLGGTPRKEGAEMKPVTTGYPEMDTTKPVELVRRSPEAIKAYLEGWNAALDRATQVLGARADVTLTLNKYRMWHAN